MGSLAGLVGQEAPEVGPGPPAGLSMVSCSGARTLECTGPSHGQL